MKKGLLMFSLFLLAAMLKVQAQLPNNSFENWQNDSAIIGFGVIPTDTSYFRDPTGWTSLNGLAGVDTFGNVTLVTESNDAHDGNSALRCETKQLDTVSYSGLTFALVVPGLVVNGDFEFDPTGLILGGVISPMSLKPAGTPITTRKKSISGWYKYAPVANDTMIIWAVLRKGTTLVAEAKFTSGTTTSAYTRFEADFKYVSCLTPDTLVYLISSSIPDLASLLGGGGTNIAPGSALLVDSVGTEELPSNFNFPPIARNDLDTVIKNTAKNISVQLNDEDCNDALNTLTLAVSVQPLHGTTVVAGNQITYTPANNFIGLDSLIYSLTDPGNQTGSATVRLLVVNSTGISESNLIPVAVYPNPTQDILHISVDGALNQPKAKVINLIGETMFETAIENNSISTSSLPNGVYVLQLISSNKTIGINRFTVTK
jgi:hypothetical protein